MVSVSYADNLCKGHFVNPITDVDWDALFPMTIGPVPVIPGELPDTANPKSPICICQMAVGYRIGITFGYWEPFSLVDITRKPFCMVNLGGFALDVGSMSHNVGSTTAKTLKQGKGSFYWAHWYKYPLLWWLNILTNVGCLETGDFDIAYLTELDPLWNDDQLSFVINPEAALFGNVIAQTACAADAAKTITGKFLPIDSLFWCLGSQGSSYPLDGNVNADVSNIGSATLLAERLNYKLHREGLAWDTKGDSIKDICSAKPTPIMPKSRYRYEMVNTVPDGEHAYPYGTLVDLWDSGHDMPGDSGNFGFLMWRKRSCCMM